MARHFYGPDRAVSPANSVAQVTDLTVTLPEAVDVEELEHEIVTAVADRLRDDHGDELMAEVRASASGTASEYPLHPTSSILVDKKPGALRGTVNLSNPRAIFAGLPPRFTRSRVDV